jgi:acetyl esterase/lipase
MPRPSNQILLRPGETMAEADGRRVPRLEPHLHVVAGAARPAVLVLPGGAYSHRADHEGGGVAAAFRERGFQAFVLHYRVAPARCPGAYLDAVAAMRHLRGHAAEYGIRPDAIALCGFSAGGHLAASVGVFADQAYPGLAPGTEVADSRPDAMILCYPVISFGEQTHPGSVQNLLGADPDPALRERLSLERRVTPATPPTFLWHTSDDAAVPVGNSLLFAEALRRHGVPFELHVFPRGAHGLGLAADHPRMAAWPDLAAAWLRETLGA